MLRSYRQADSSNSSAISIISVAAWRTALREESVEYRNPGQSLRAPSWICCIDWNVLELRHVSHYLSGLVDHRFAHIITRGKGGTVVRFFIFNACQILQRLSRGNTCLITLCEVAQVPQAASHIHNSSTCIRRMNLIWYKKTSDSSRYSQPIYGQATQSFTALILVNTKKCRDRKTTPAKDFCSLVNYYLICDLFLNNINVI